MNTQEQKLQHNVLLRCVIVIVKLLKNYFVKLNKAEII